MEKINSNSCKKYFILQRVLWVTVFVFLAGLSCQKESPILGKYRCYSENPEIQRGIAHEDNYIEIKKDTIIYNITINQKPKSHIKGTYRFDEKSNDLEIKWEEGNLISKLKMKNEGKNYWIQVGEYIYRKQ